MKFYRAYVAVTEADTQEQADAQFDDDGAEFGSTVEFVEAGNVTAERPDALGEDWISRESVIEALRDAERHDSAADAVEYVSDLVGWVASSDPILLAEKVAEAGWPSVADDIREGVPLETVVSRLREFHGGEADELIALIEVGS